MTAHRLSGLALISFTVFLAAGCSSSSDVEESPSMRSTADSTASSETMVMRDSDIAGIVLTANQGGVDLGEMARGRATNAEVRRFAEMMVTGHREVIQKHQAIVARTGMKTSETALRTQLRNSGTATAEILKQRSGSDFDRAYMRSQIDMHQWLLDALDKSLIPASKNGSLRSYLHEVRDAVATHLTEARRIESSM